MDCKADAWLGRATLIFGGIAAGAVGAAASAGGYEVFHLIHEWRYRPGIEVSDVVASLFIVFAGAVGGAPIGGVAALLADRFGVRAWRRGLFGCVGAVSFAAGATLVAWSVMTLWAHRMRLFPSLSELVAMMTAVLGGAAGGLGLTGVITACVAPRRGRRRTDPDSEAGRPSRCT